MSASKVSSSSVAAATDLVVVHSVEGHLTNGTLEWMQFRSR
jgi:hypothetical protein